MMENAGTSFLLALLNFLAQKHGKQDLLKPLRRHQTAFCFSQQKCTLHRAVDEACEIITLCLL